MLPRRSTILTLVFDSEYGPRDGGARSLLRWRRRLLYRAGTAEVDLEVRRSKTAGYLRMLGQVTTGQSFPTQVRVDADGPSGRRTSASDDVGQFLFDVLVAGDHRVMVALPHELIIVPLVPVRPCFPFDHADLVAALGLIVPPLR